VLPAATARMLHQRSTAGEVRGSGGFGPGAGQHEALTALLGLRRESAALNGANHEPKSTKNDDAAQSATSVSLPDLDELEAMMGTLRKIRKLHSAFHSDRGNSVAAQGASIGTIPVAASPLNELTSPASQQVLIQGMFQGPSPSFPTASHRNKKMRFVFGEDETALAGNPKEEDGVGIFNEETKDMKRSGSMFSSMSTSSAEADLQSVLQRLNSSSSEQAIVSGATISTRKRCNSCRTCLHQACERCTNCLNKKKRKRSCENRLPCMEQLVIFARQVFNRDDQSMLVGALQRQTPSREEMACSLNLIEERQTFLKNQRKALQSEDRALNLLKQALKDNIMNE